MNVSVSVSLWSIVSAVAVSVLATAAPTSSFPGVQPQLAAVGDRVYLAFGRADTISVARSDDGGETFGTPVRLPLAGRLALGMHRGPRVAATGSTVLVTAVAGAKGGGADGDVLLFRSTDRGTSWAAPVVVNDVPGSAREGLQALAASPSGLVVIAWLDLRAAGTRIFAAVSRDHGATWAPDVLAYASPAGSVCECCHPSVAIDGSGGIAVMFRNHVAGSRDMYVVRSTADGRFASATKAGTGSWRLNACPMDGGGLAFDDNGVVTVWRRENGIFLSSSTVPERRLGTGRDPAIATTGTRHDIAWGAPEGIVLMRDSAPVVAVAPGRFPAILALQDTTILAWEDQGAVLVRAIPR
jgi:hypothetical protein